MSQAGMGDRLKKIAEERDPGAFRSLFLTYCPKVQALMMRQGADSDTAEEIAQETMLTVWSKSHLFCRQKGSVSTWIYSIARNLRIDRVRRQIVWQNCYGDLEMLQRVHSAADEGVTRDQDRVQIEQALAGLPPEQLQIIKLSFVDGLSQSEIASRLKLPLGTVKSRMRLAFDKLRGSAEVSV